MTAWDLPVTTNLGGTLYHLHTDYRDILEIFSYLDDPDLPEEIRWHIALGLFYEEPVAQCHMEEAAVYLLEFLGCGQPPQGKSERLLCWQKDAPMIVAEINKVAGQEIRSLPYLHWWTFMGFFHTIGEGQLSAVVAIRHKLQKGKPLERWEKQFYGENRQLVDLPKRYSREELQQRDALLQLLDHSEGRPCGDPEKGA